MRITVQDFLLIFILLNLTEVLYKILCIFRYYNKFVVYCNEHCDGCTAITETFKLFVSCCDDIPLIFFTSFKKEHVHPLKQQNTIHSRPIQVQFLIKEKTKMTVERFASFNIRRKTSFIQFTT
ncbi:Protein of unknown function [Gryllus bimaculatus]|nr:Protein of unknown function [Gryllus bimaculatus]